MHSARALATLIGNGSTLSLIAQPARRLAAPGCAVLGFACADLGRMHDQKEGAGC